MASCVDVTVYVDDFQVALLELTSIPHLREIMLRGMRITVNVAKAAALPSQGHAPIEVETSLLTDVGISIANK